jgi:hypothetical protein
MLIVVVHVWDAFLSTKPQYLVQDLVRSPGGCECTLNVHAHLFLVVSLNNIRAIVGAV